MPIKEFPSVPAMKSLYGKALRGFIKQPSGEPILPQDEFSYSGQEDDLGRLARYDSVCGFRLSDRLPATYPHVLAFPLQMSLLTDQSFPFPVLGLVHVSNRITQHRSLRLRERFTIKVWAKDLRSHGSGSQFDLVSHLFVGNESSPIWRETSTYLRRGDKRAERTPSRDSKSRPREDQGSHSAIPLAVWRVPADIGRRYAEVSGDRNPIHLSSLTARMFGFRSAIAHGMWMKARCLASFEGRIPERFAIETQFKSPLLVPSRTAFLAHQSSTGWSYELRSSTRDRAYLTGEISDFV